MLSNDILSEVLAFEPSLFDLIYTWMMRGCLKSSQI
jgi:hypothetical protein